jgi:hypothetical protein
LIYIRFMGLEKTVFKNNNNKDFKGVSEVFTKKIILFQNDDNEVIPEGVHSFEFTIQLPERFFFLLITIKFNINNLNILIIL